MDILKAIGLGILQGLSEFLPVSSSGHLVVFQKLFGFEEHNLTFDVVVHLATLLSVFTVMRKPVLKIVFLFLGDLRDRCFGRGLSIFLKVCIGTIPAVMVGLFFRDVFEGLFQSPKTTGFFFLLTGALLFATRFLKGKDDSMEIENEEIVVDSVAKTTWVQSLIVGVFQSIAIAPGVSRSGSTIAAGLLFGMNKSAAAYFSFLLAIPAILGAGFLQLPEVSFDQVDLGFMGAGFLAAYLSGIFGLTMVLKAVKSGRLDYFSFYVIPLGVFCIFYF